MTNNIVVIFDYSYIYKYIDYIFPVYKKIFIRGFEIEKLKKIEENIKNKDKIIFIGGISAFNASLIYKPYKVFLLIKSKNSNINKIKNKLNYYIIEKSNIEDVSYNYLSKILYENCIEYPYYDIFYKFNKKHIIEIINNFKPIIYNDIPNELKHKGFELKKFNNQYFIIKDDWIKNQEINDLTNLFSEKVRITCSFGNNLSPYDYWNKYKNQVIEDVILEQKQENKINLYKIREKLFEKTRFCTNFRIAVTIPILEYFNAKKWLDISSGWGDRLLSAVLYKVKKYVSADPNKDLHSCYKNIINTFVPKSKHSNFRIFEGGFENIPLDDTELFDIVFSSPPFFTLEKYSKYNNNSITQYKNEKTWVEKFFLKSLIKCYNHLEKNGHMILYMGGSKNIFDNMFKLNNVMDYKGIIYFYDTKPRAMYVWKKINNNKILKL